MMSSPFNIFKNFKFFYFCMIEIDIVSINYEKSDMIYNLFTLFSFKNDKQ